MSGRRKHIEEASYQLTIQLEEGETIARVIKVSSNLVEVENANDTKCLVLLPKKFNKRFWLKVGSFVIIELDDEKQDPTNRKIKGTITRILYPDQIRELKKQDGVWPKYFDSGAEKVPTMESLTIQQHSKEGDRESPYSEDSEDDLPPLMPNPNRNRNAIEYSEDDSDSS